MNFNAVILILAGIAEIARITEKLAQRSQCLYGNQRDLSDPSDGAAITIAGINRTMFYLLSAIPCSASDRSDRKLKVNPVFTHRISGTNLTLVTNSCS